MNKEKIIIISSPSGAGKTTICKKILKTNKNIKLSVSYTTRLIRKNETNGVDYYFVNKKEFIKLKKEKFFIETAKVFDYLYGSPLKNIKKSFKANKHILFDIDWQGANKLRKKFSKNDIIDFFILPPSKNELKNRLTKRGRENSNEINKRLSLAVNEISHFNDYKYVIVNESIEQTVKSVLKLIQYEEFIFELNQKVSSLKIF